jgi:hypothetical protein
LKTVKAFYTPICLKRTQADLRGSVCFAFAILCDFASLREMLLFDDVGSRKGAKPQGRAKQDTDPYI